MILLLEFKLLEKKLNILKTSRNFRFFVQKKKNISKSMTKILPN